jgi:hypothetical protein
MALLMTRIYAAIVSRFQTEVATTNTTQKALDVAWEPIINLMAFPFAQVKTFNTILHLQKDFELISDALHDYTSHLPECKSKQQNSIVKENVFKMMSENKADRKKKKERERERKFFQMFQSV